MGHAGAIRGYVRYMYIDCVTDQAFVYRYYNRELSTVKLSFVMMLTPKIIIQRLRI